MKIFVLFVLLWAILKLALVLRQDKPQDKRIDKTNPVLSCPVLVLPLCLVINGVFWPFYGNARQQDAFLNRSMP